MKSGLDLTGVNPNIRPQDDLYLHVNGAWMDSAEIPSDRPSDGAFYRLRDQSEANIREIIEESAKANSTPGSEARKVGDLYASFMDEATIEKLGSIHFKAISIESYHFRIWRTSPACLVN